MAPQTKTRPDALLVLERLSRVIHNDGYQHGLKPTQWEVLRYLQRANRFSRTPGAVTAYLGMTKGTVSQTLAALERKGLVQKTAAPPEDRRKVALNLTREGRTLLSKDPLTRLQRAAAQLSGPQQSALADSLSALLETALRQRQGRPFGVCRNCRFFSANGTGGRPHRCNLLDEPLSRADSQLICAEQVAKTPGGGS